MKLTVEVDDAILARAMDITCAKSEEEAVRTSLHSLSSDKSLQEERYYLVSVEGLRKYLGPESPERPPHSRAAPEPTFAATSPAAEPAPASA